MRSFVLVFVLSIAIVIADPSCPGNCTRDSHGKCEPQVKCFVDPCSLPMPFQTRLCLRQNAGSRCVSDTCGGCNRYFVNSNGNQICQTVIPEGGNCTTSTFHNRDPAPCDDGLYCMITDPGNPDKNVPDSGICTEYVDPICEGDCPRDDAGDCVPFVNCFIDPCEFTPSACVGRRNITCEADYCGTCSARWYDTNGTEICLELNEGAACTDSTNEEDPSIPCDRYLFCNISDIGNPSMDEPPSGECSECVSYTLCHSDADCSIFGRYFKCIGVSTGCSPSTCTTSTSCTYDFCTADCVNAGYCEQVVE